MQHGSASGWRRAVVARAGACLVLGALGATLGGCVSEATYEQSVLDARTARSESARRDEIQAQLHTQMLALNERLQIELTRQAQIQEQMLAQMAQMRDLEGNGRGTKGNRAGEVQALQQRIRQLEEQQREAMKHTEELQAEVTRLQNSRTRVIRTTNGRAPVRIDTENPWY